MSTRAKWLLIGVLGLMIHITHVGFAVASLSPQRENPSMTAMVIPFGQLNCSNAASIAAIEWLLLVVLWVVFAVALLRGGEHR
jgi:Ca2+/Na+ antiporter